MFAFIVVAKLLKLFTTAAMKRSVDSPCLRRVCNASLMAALISEASSVLSSPPIPSRSRFFAGLPCFLNSFRPFLLLGRWMLGNPFKGGVLDQAVSASRVASFVAAGIPGFLSGLFFFRASCIAFFFFLSLSVFLLCFCIPLLCCISGTLGCIKRTAFGQFFCGLFKSIFRFVLCF